MFINCLLNNLIKYEWCCRHGDRYSMVRELLNKLGEVPAVREYFTSFHLFIADLYSGAT